jgi:hypothetical protein
VIRDPGKKPPVNLAAQTGASVALAEQTAFAK